MKKKKIQQKVHKPYPLSKLVDAGVYLDMLLGKALDVSDQIWVTVEGEHILFKNLRKSHIINILKFMDKRPGWRSDQRAGLEQELKRREKAKLIKKTKAGELFYGQ